MLQGLLSVGCLGGNHSSPTQGIAAVGAIITCALDPGKTTQNKLTIYGTPNKGNPQQEPQFELSWNKFTNITVDPCAAPLRRTSDPPFIVEEIELEELKNLHAAIRQGDPEAMAPGWSVTWSDHRWDG